MSELETRKTRASVKKFIDGIADESQREDFRKLVGVFEKVTRQKPAMWGPAMVGFGSYHYKYDSGREGDWFVAGLSPRKQAITLYVMPGFDGYDGLMADLGKVKTGKACIYVKRLGDIHVPTLEKLVRKSVAHVKKLYP